MVCVHNGIIERIGPPEEIFTGDYIRKLFDIQADSEDLFVLRGGKRLRCGRTTGTCAALAAQGAVRLLLTRTVPASASLTTPKGAKIEAPLEDCHMEGDSAFCSVRKDGGDDVDATHGLLITAQVERQNAPGVSIEGGAGVGRVTKPGLDQSVGSAATTGPRRMIEQEVLPWPTSWVVRGFSGDRHVPGGAEPPKNFNPAGSRAASPFWVPPAL